MRKNDLVAQIYRAGIEGADGHGGDYPAIVPLLPTGKDAAAPHLTWNDSPVLGNAGTFFEIAGCYKRYRSEEHTSELQSLMRNSYAVFCLKKKTYKNNNQSRN